MSCIIWMIQLMLPGWNGMSCIIYESDVLPALDLCGTDPSQHLKTYVPLTEDNRAPQTTYVSDTYNTLYVEYCSISIIGRDRIREFEKINHIKIKRENNAAHPKFVPCGSHREAR